MKAPPPPTRTVRHDQTDLSRIMETHAFFLPRGSTGCLLVHGLTSTPFTMRLMGDRMAAAGITVLAPVLAGHDTVWRRLERTGWLEWFASVETAYDRLRRRCRRVFAAGISMGGAQVLHLAAHHPELAGVIALAPAVRFDDWRLPFLPVVRRVVKTLKGIGGDTADPNRAVEYHYDRLPTRTVGEMVRFQAHLADDLPQVHCPALIMQGALDHVLPRDSGRWAWERIGSKKKKLVILRRSAHVLTLDREREKVFRLAIGFIRHRSR
jgi:carboxylesterase